MPEPTPGVPPALTQPATGTALRDPRGPSGLDVPQSDDDQHLVAKGGGLDAALLRAVLETNGVLGIEPTIADVVVLLGRSLQSAALSITHRHAAGDHTPDATSMQPRAALSPAARPSHPDGLRIAGHGGQVDVSVDLCVQGDPSALQTARAVRSALSDVIVAYGLRPGRIGVAVLRVEPDTTATPAVPTPESPLS